MVSRIPNGIYTAHSQLDNDGRNLDKPLDIKVTVTVADAEMTIDFSEVNKQVPTPMNSGYSGGMAAARIAFKCLTMPDAPVNEGCFRPLNLILPEGVMLNAKAPAAIGLWSIALPTVIDTILKALASALPDVIPAAHKGDMGGCSFYGYREDDGKRFLLMNIFGGGWGGRPGGDGEDASVSICQSDVRNAPVEIQEINYPFIVERHALRPDSGGAGAHRGGLGIEICYRCLQRTTVNINLERIVDPPWGVAGGASGAVNRAVIRRVDGSEEEAFKATNVPLEAGDTVTFMTAGGGGYGDPAGRDLASIEADLAEGLITPAAAARDYGYAHAGRAAE